MHYCRIPAAYRRVRFGFERLPDFDKTLWDKVRRECDGAMRPLPEGLVSGSDISREAAGAARTNCRSLPGGEKIRVKAMPFQGIDSLEDSVIVCNPPYGIRLKSGEKPDELLGELSSFLKERCRGSDAYIYLGKERLLKAVRLRAAWKKPMKNGGLNGFLSKYRVR
jgi:putative N6-adenine-specific DNA methylase